LYNSEKPQPAILIFGASGTGNDRRQGPFFCEKKCLIIRDSRHR
jgi:hypothetical protein